ncbi:MAG: OmpA family protein [Rickettsiales bacterium]|jgi:outer membrane protein OmpA-like peptidoglycan-associated protein|nr:OmpA family protein [Rickettsiales bacterium]
MKRLFLAAIPLISACATAPEKPRAERMEGEANFEVMNAKSVIVGKPTLVKLGIRPLSLSEARPYMNELFAKLTPELEKTNITYQMQGNDIVLIIQAHLALDAHDNIHDDMKGSLDKFAEILAAERRNFVEFQGHTSSVGGKGANQIKSMMMAQKLADYFMDRGVSPHRVFINGMGESRWISDNRTREGRLLNTRIEVRITPLI